MKTNITSVSRLGKAISGLGLILLLCVSTAFADDIIKEDFEDASGWTMVTNGTAWAIDDDKKHTGDKSANCADGEFTDCTTGTYLPNTASTISKTYTTGFTADGEEHPIRDFVNLRLTFYYKCTGDPSWDYGQVKINSTLVAPLIDHDLNPATPPQVVPDEGYACSGSCPDEWTKEDIDISQFDRTDEFILEFYFQSDARAPHCDGFFVDDIVVTGDWSLTVPDPPTNPGPADDERDVPLDTGLSWENPGVPHNNTDQVKVLLDIVTDEPPDPPTTVVHAFSASSDPLTEEYSLSNAVIGGPLSGSSTYQWTVITKNTSSGDTAQRTWSFKTACSVVTAFPWFEGFEYEWEEQPATAPATAPRCWTPIADPTATPQPTNYWEPNESTVHSGAYSAKGPWDSAGGIQWLLTPEMDMEESGETNLKFWLKGSHAGGTNLYVMIGDSKAPADLNDDHFTLLKSYIAGINMPDNWEAQVIDLTAYSGGQYDGNKYIAFKMVDTDGWNVYIDDIQVYAFHDKTSTVTEGGDAEPTTIASTADTEGEAVYVFDVTFNDGDKGQGGADGLSTVIDQIKFTQAANNEVPDWTDAIEGAKLFGPDIGAGGLVGTVEADHILFTGVDFISVAHNDDETYQLRIWLKTDLSAVKDHDKLGFKLDHTDVITDISGSFFIQGAPESGGDGVAIDITATQLKFTTQPHDRAVVDRVLPIIPVVTAQDANGNTDLDYTGTVTLTNTTNLIMADNAEAAINGVVKFNAVKFTQIGGNTNLVTTNTNGLANDTTTIAIMVTDPSVRIWPASGPDNFQDSAANWNLAGEFEIGPPLGKGGSSGSPDPSIAYDGTNVLGTDLSGLGDNLGDCEPKLDDREYFATSETIDCSGYTRVALKFYRWLNTQDTDYAYIDVYDGANWQQVWVSSDIIEETAWSLQDIDISAHANNNPNVKIRFGYGASDETFFYSGWNIDAVEVVQQPQWNDMSYSSSEALQKNNNYVVQGSVDQEIIGIRVITNNPGTPLVMNNFLFSTQGSTQNSDIAKAKVYYTGGSDAFATGTLFGETSTIEDAFSIAGSQPLIAGVNYFWLAYDIKTDALIDHYVDAKLTEITIGTTDYTPSVQEPAGNRKVISPPELGDVIYILQVLTGYPVSIPFLMARDYNANGMIDMGDALFTLEYLAKLRDF